jgi:hypothetical protein
MPANLGGGKCRDVFNQNRRTRKVPSIGGGVHAVVVDSDGYIESSALEAKRHAARPAEQIDSHGRWGGIGRSNPAHNRRMLHDLDLVVDRCGVARLRRG